MKRQHLKNTRNTRASPPSDVGDGNAKYTRASPKSDGRAKQQSTVTMSELRIASWNIGTMTGRSAELSAILERRHINICCVQETKWKGAKSRQIGKGFKFIYYGTESGRNGVGIILDQYLSQKVIEINRTSDRIMSVKLALENQTCLNIVCVYAPQVGCPETDKQDFWEELCTHMNALPVTEQRIICGDLNGHVGSAADGFEDHHGGFGYGSQNKEGTTILEFAASLNLVVVNTFFQKKEEHLITYKSGKSKTQIDYIMTDRKNLRQIKDCKVIPGEPLTSQHRLLLAALKLKRQIKYKIPRVERIKWRELNTENGRNFKNKVCENLGNDFSPDDSPTTNWSKFQDACIAQAKATLGISKGPLHGEKDAKWWNNNTKATLSEKKRLFKKWQESDLDEDKLEYKEAKKIARRSVAINKENAELDLYQQLELASDTEIYKIAKHRHNNTKDFRTTKYIKDSRGTLLTSDKDICKRWYEYYHTLLNEEFPRQVEIEEPRTQGPVNQITITEVKKAIMKMKNHKACGPDDIPAELWKSLKADGEVWLTNLFNNILTAEEMPDAWRKSTLVPFYKNKGDVRECGNYRGIKLTSHTLKIWERVLSDRLASLISLTENQFGFTAGKGTMDAIHAVRLVMEKAKENDQNLWMVFIDLEKAFDRVPRTVIWQALRAHSVPECYIRIIKDLYNNIQTCVKSAAGLSDSFDIKVGVHQGSALSPLLFNVVMNYLTAKIQKPTPWNLLYADDVVLISDNVREIQEDLDRWRESLEQNGLRISRTKTEYMFCNFNRNILLDPGITLGGTALPRVKSFKYLGSVLSEDGGIEMDITQRTTSGWMKWRTLTGVLCDAKMPVRTKGKVYKTAVRPALLYGSEVWATKKTHEQKLHTTEMRMLRWAGGVTLKDKVRNEYIRGSFKVAPITDKISESRLRWYGHIMRRPDDYVVKKCLSMATKKRGRGRPQTTWLTNVQRDMKRLGLNDEDANMRTTWRRMIRKADPE